MDKFRDWYIKNYQPDDYDLIGKNFLDHSILEMEDCYNDAYESATESMQAKLDKQAKELEALRGIVRKTLKTGVINLNEFGHEVICYPPNIIVSLITGIKPETSTTPPLKD